MRRVREFLNHWFGEIRTRRDISALDKKISDLHLKLLRSEGVIEKERAELEDLQGQLNKRIIKLNDALQVSSTINKKLEAALEAAQEALKIRDDFLIPGLMAADRALTSRWEREATIHAMAQAGIVTEKNYDSD